MSDMDINKVLADMRALAAQAKQAPAETGAASGDGADFGSLLRQSIDSVNDAQQQAASSAEAFQAGEPGADLTQVMVELQKADLSFRAMTEVRNKLLDAYNEIMNMPI